MSDTYPNVLEKIFRMHKDEEKAKGMSKYMKDNFPFFGIMKPLRSKLQKSFIKEYGLPGKENWKSIVEALWNKEEREFQYFACDIIPKTKKYWRESDHEFLKELITKRSWWDTVDTLSINAAGEFFRLFPEEKYNIIEAWSEDENMWLNRTSILFQLKYKNNTDIELLFYIIEKHKGSREFFIQKAIGWALRELGKTKPETVLEFTGSTQLKPLSRREALKHLGGK